LKNTIVFPTALEREATASGAPAPGLPRRLVENLARRRWQGWDLEKLMNGVLEGSDAAADDLHRLAGCCVPDYACGLPNRRSLIEDAAGLGLRAIREGALDRPESLPGFIQTIIVSQLRLISKAGNSRTAKCIPFPRDNWPHRRAAGKA
jgi:hypothetical protein